MGAAIGFGFVIVLAVVIPPVQTAVVAIPTIIVGVLNRARQEHLRQAGYVSGSIIEPRDRGDR
jgi:hypothetical protein